LLLLRALKAPRMIAANTNVPPTDIPAIAPALKPLTSSVDGDSGLGGWLGPGGLGGVGKHGCPAMAKQASSWHTSSSGMHECPR
jgi:hypothetical protein